MSWYSRKTTGERPTDATEEPFWLKLKRHLGDNLFTTLDLKSHKLRDHLFLR